ncbi:hypothetical protein H9Q72_013616 [Fusarium xylarioides]|uniref:PD-(D/E)XK nuclease-like domain-containing protein n=1 Tax=Fusarium xylarioides TaxID=221167 RepID=A0A9P7KV10_9HYPO|nr:hypothetical protein H9Q72_013616 [Fusarium xylarioides]
MSLEQRIEHWLNQLQTTPQSSHRHKQTTAKRRRLNPSTPDPSESDHGMASRGQSQSRASSKRKTTESPTPYHDQTDDFETPRPKRKLKAPNSESGTSLASSEISSRSGYSSPTKQLRDLEFHDRGVVAKELKDFHTKPASLKLLLQKIDRSSAGCAILPTSLRDTMNELDPVLYENFDWTKDSFTGQFCFSDERDKLGQTPPPMLVRDILDAAGTCNTGACSEAEWNTEVHFLVLRAALRPFKYPQTDPVFDFRLSTTTSIIPTYQATSASKKVDFCAYIDPAHDSAADVSDTIRALRSVLPLGMFNYTNQSLLKDKPIAVSIETKKTGEGWDNARLQMEVWMAAHWQFLRQLLDLRQRMAEQVAKKLGSALPGPGLDKTWKLPEFLPGIIIQGHDWYLIITTPEGEKIAFWQKKLLGQTSESKGIYAIVFNLQLLREWAMNEYWKWMKELLLGWPRYQGKLVVTVSSEKE